MNISKIVAGFQMIGSRIVHLKISNTLVAINDIESIKRQLELSHSIGEIRTVDESFICQLQLNIKVKLKSAKDTCIFDMTVEGCFTSKDSDEKKFLKMLNLNGIATLYGVARGIVASISSQTFADGVITLPMINVLEYSRQIEVESTGNKGKQDTK